MKIHFNVETVRTLLGGYFDGSVEGVEGGSAVVGGVLHDRHVAHQHGREGVDGQSLPVVDLGQLEALLLVVSQADPVPGVVVPPVQADRGPGEGGETSLVGAEIGGNLGKPEVIRNKKILKLKPPLSYGKCPLLKSH